MSAPNPALRVLVVDDDEDHAASTAALLYIAGHAPSIALDGDEAFDKAARVRPEVVLLDIGLPKMDGYELAGRLRLCHDAPFLVAVTGRGGDEDRRRSHLVGIDLHLVKPVDPAYLLGVLERFSRFARP